MSRRNGGYVNKLVAILVSSAIFVDIAIPTAHSQTQVAGKSPDGVRIDVRKPLNLPSQTISKSPKAANSKSQESGAKDANSSGTPASTAKEKASPTFNVGTAHPTTAIPVSSSPRVPPNLQFANVSKPVEIPILDSAATDKELAVTKPLISISRIEDSVPIPQSEAAAPRKSSSAIRSAVPSALSSLPVDGTKSRKARTQANQGLVADTIQLELSQSSDLLIVDSTPPETTLHSTNPRIEVPSPIGTPSVYPMPMGIDDELRAKQSEVPITDPTQSTQFPALSEPVQPQIDASRTFPIKTDSRPVLMESSEAIVAPGTNPVPAPVPTVTFPPAVQAPEIVNANPPNPFLGAEPSPVVANIVEAQPQNSAAPPTTASNPTSTNPTLPTSRNKETVVGSMTPPAVPVPQVTTELPPTVPQAVSNAPQENTGSSLGLRSLEEASDKINSVSVLPESLAEGMEVRRLTSKPWWYDYVQMPVLTNENANAACAADLQQLIGLSLIYSPRVREILIVPGIQRTEIGIAQGDLDPRAFALSKFHNNSDPVGSTLATGGPKRLEELFWENTVGARDKNVYGGKLEWSQAINTRDNNSLFFQPKQQGDLKLAVNFTQPLLRGAGKFYNTASIRIAGLKTEASVASANLLLQEHAMNIIREYYDLVLNRSLLVQNMNGHKRLAQILENLEARTIKDVDRGQLSRARGAIAGLEATIESTKANIRGNEARLRRLVNSPAIKDPSCKELIPVTMPIYELIPISVESEMISALQLRGDVLEIQNNIEVASVQKRVAINELRPQLDAIAETYVHGLDSNYDVGQAFGNQFTQGRPSYYAGATYLAPYGNRSAKANLRGRALEIEKLTREYEESINNVRASLEAAAARVEGAFEATNCAIRSTLESFDETQQHKELFLNNDGRKSESAILDTLLDAEQRLIKAENDWAARHIEYMRALTQVKYESGTLLSVAPE